MIDYIDVVIPMKHDAVIRKGYKCVTKEDGTSTESNYPLIIWGVNGSSMKVQSIDSKTVRITGNPANFIQGQNVFGTDELISLCYGTFRRIAEKLEITPTKQNLKKWRYGKYQVNVIDVTYNYNLGSQQTVCEWLDNAAKSISSGKQLITSYRKGQGHVETIYAGQGSNEICVKFYNKFRQLTSGSKNKKKIKNLPPLLQELVESTEPLLRCEIRFHKAYLKSKGLTTANSLTPEVLRKLFNEKLSIMNLGTNKIVTTKSLKELTNPQRLAYNLWLKGGDIKSELSKSAYERLCSKFLDVGINIRKPYADILEEPLDFYVRRQNVVNPPDFIVDSKWYFRPAKR